MTHSTKHRLRSLSLITAAALALSACNAGPSSTYDDAARAYEQGELRIARAHLADVIANGEPSEQTYELQMRVMLELGDGYAAMAALEKVPDTVLGGANRRVAKAHAFILQGNHHRAAEMYETLELDAFTEQDFRMALWALRDMGEDDDFAEGMDAALEAFPESADLNAMAGDALIDMGLAEEAPAYAERAKKADPENLDTLLLLGRVAISEDDLDTALKHYAKAAELHPYHPLPQANVAGLQLDQGKIEQAGETLKRAFADHSDHPYVRWQKARHALATEDFDAARESLEFARRTYAGDDEFVLLTAQVEDRLGNRELAISEYRRYLRSVGSDPKVEARLKQIEG